jgi:2-isopropylmalate synthase
VNSQSGKGGVSFLLQNATGFELPRRLQIEFSRIVQKVSDETSKEVNTASIVSLFEESYLQVDEPYRYMSSHVIDAETSDVVTKMVVNYNDQRIELGGTGNGPLDAAAKALSEHIGQAVTVADYHEHGMSAGSDAAAVSYVEVKVGEAAAVFGVGQDKNITTAAIKALINGVNRVLNEQQSDASSSRQNAQ